jgi:hypothetical protein
MNILILDDSTTMHKIMEYAITNFFTLEEEVKKLAIIRNKEIKLDNLFFATNAKDAYDVLLNNNIDLLMQDTSRPGEYTGNNQKIVLVLFSYKRLGKMINSRI